MEIKSLENTGLTGIYEAFSQAFRDYEVQISGEQFFKMLKRRGFTPELSFGAFQGDRLISFTLNGTGSYNGVPTAYDTGTGTLPEYQGQGLATRIFEYSIPFLKEHNIENYLLEVLQHNTKAVSVYRKLGFQITREFNYYVLRKEDIDFPAKKRATDYNVQEMKPDELDGIFDFWDFHPSWQNSMEAINRQPDEFKVFGAFAGGFFIGYCVCEPGSGDISQLAVKKQYRRTGVASQLLEHALKTVMSGTVKIINTDTRCSTISGFLSSFDISVTGRQFEMMKRLNES